MDVPQLLTTETVGVDGVAFGCAFPPPGALSHPPTVWVTVNMPEVDTVIDGDIAPVLHISVPV